MAKTGPGQSHREGMSLPAFFKRFPDDAAAQAFFVSVRWPDGIECPRCGSSNVQLGAAHRSMPYRCRAKGCAKRFSLKTGTVMEGSNLGFHTWLTAMYLLNTSLKSVSSMKLHRDLDVTQRTAWFLAHRLRETWKEIEDPFLGPVEVDETHIGGTLRNMHGPQREAARHRFNYGKTIVAGVRDRNTNRVSATAIDHADSHTLQDFIGDRVVSDAMVYTDDGPAYRTMPFFDHESVNHSAGEYVRGEAHTNGMESFWSTFKRAYKGTFHHLSQKHLDRYFTEFAGRHNNRHADTEDQLRRIAGGMMGRRLKYADLIR